MSDEANTNEMQHPVSPEPSDDNASYQADAQHGDDSEPRFDVAGAALGALDADEETQLLNAAAGDTSVASELVEMQTVAAELARLAPERPMNRGRSAGIRSRLVARAAATHMGLASSSAATATGEADRTTARPLQRANAARSAPAVSLHGAAQPASPPARQSASRRSPTHFVPFEPESRAGIQRIVSTLAVAAVLVIAAFGIYKLVARSALNRGSATAEASRDSMLEARIASLETSLAEKDSLIGVLTGTRTRVIDLIGFKSVDPMARMFWDQKTQMFIMYASHLRPPTPGKTYQVWLIARGVASPISAGTFMPDSAGSAVLARKQPMEPGTLRRIAVTEEPMGGMPSPTGPVVFTGTGR